MIKAEYLAIAPYSNLWTPEHELAEWAEDVKALIHGNQELNIIIEEDE